LNPEFVVLDNEELLDLVEFLEVIEGKWLPFSFDSSVRDYTRIKFKGGYKVIDGQQESVYYPIIAIDTKLGNPQEGFLSSQSDVGQTFTAGHINQLIPNDRNYVNRWLSSLGDLPKDYEGDHHDTYLKFLTRVLESLNNNQNCTDVSGRKNFAEFKLVAPVVPTPIDVNLYLDLGNSRSVGLLFEDNQAAPKFSGNVYPLKVLNYENSFKEGFKYETEDLIFVSAVEFSEPLFTKNNQNNKTFKWPSMVKIGREAQEIASEPNPFSTQTGLSGPKRYLWDDVFREDLIWHFGNAPEKRIQGELLKYFANSDPDDISDDNLDEPTFPRYVRRSMVTQYIIEILNQAYRQINSFEHRTNNHTLRKRRLKRIVCSYPSGYTDILKQRFKKQLYKASKIFSEFMGLEEPIEVDLGLDEASASQIVFLETIIKNYKGQLGTIGKYIFRTDPNNKFRIASIDIGGGTTDIMISEYDLNDYQRLGSQLEGEIKLLDSTQYGGDDIAKNIIQEFILPEFKRHAGEDNQFFEDLFYSDRTDYQSKKKKTLNLIIWPITLMLINKVIGEDEFVYPEGSSISLREFLSGSALCPNPGALDNLHKDLREEGWDIESFNMNDFQVPSAEKINKLIGSNKDPLVRTLYQYSCVINAHRPSFVIVSGKLSSLDVIQKRISKFLPSSPERIVFLDGFRPGKWYPFLLNEIITDPKTSVAVGMAIADVARNASVNDGCYANIRMGSYSNINFIGCTEVAHVAHVINLRTKHVLLDMDDEQAKREYPINGAIGVVYRNVNSDAIPCNPIYTIELKKGFTPDNNDPLKMKIFRDPQDYTKVKFTFSGSVNSNEGPQKIDEESHLNIQYCTQLNHDYYLDNPTFEKT
tara:strand:- start:4121 stop:6721 length:2601 start_codon:yes stop_codon:yes gene_type:complete